MKLGDRVRYRFAHRDTGTIMKRVTLGVRGGGNWYVKWDHDPYGPRWLPAYEENLEPEDTPRARTESREGK